ncbi:restriction endonuclease subunit S [Aliivibrio fischeri]|uniref:restriction endonuclease subunit S n=1 Tax=Aliivibrio fischeri TaxID=668 RepID=UPI0009C03312|nr:restriction endonuclease subunit S [Aliivibrio fischeri]
MSWPMVAIKTVGKVTTGKTPSKKVDDYFGGDIPFVTPAELGDSHYVKPSKQTLTEKGGAKIKLVSKNSVLVCCIGSLGKVAIADRELGTNQQINAVTFDETKVFPKYGYYALKRLKPILESIAPSTTVAIVNKSTFEALDIPLPPLEEQKRIAVILDKADAIRQKRKQAIELADEFLRSVFLDMFGDPVTNPKGWAKKELNCLLRSIDSGKSLKCESRVAKDSEWGILKVSAVTSGKYKNNENKAFLGDARLISKYEVKAGDLLFTRKNTHKLVAAVSYVFETEGKKSLPDLIFRLNIKDENELSSVYLHGLLACSSQRAEIQALAGGAAGSMPNISKANLSKILLPVPDIKSQKKYEEIVYKHRKLIKDLSFAPKYDSLFNALSQKAFSGQL